MRGLEPGDIATIQPQVTCGTCYPCTLGAYHICDSLKVMGFQTTGAGSEFSAVAADKVPKLPAGMDLEHGAMIEPAAVMTTDVSQFRLDLAGECGVDARVNVAGADLSAAVRERFGEKADLILECVGSPQAITQAVAAARKGTDIIVVGVFGDKPTVDMGTVQDRELLLIGTLMYQDRDWRKAIDLVEKGKIRLAPLITHHFDFADYRKALRVHRRAPRARQEDHDRRGEVQRTGPDGSCSSSTPLARRSSKSLTAFCRERYTPDCQNPNPNIGTGRAP